MSYLDLTVGKRLNFPFALKLGARLAVWRSRRALAKLDARGLEDIGVTAQEADREARLAAWDVPDTWKGV